MVRKLQCFSAVDSHVQIKPFLGPSCAYGELKFWNVIFPSGKNLWELALVWGEHPAV